MVGLDLFLEDGIGSARTLGRRAPVLTVDYLLITRSSKTIRSMPERHALHAVRPIALRMSLIRESSLAFLLEVTVKFFTPALAAFVEPVFLAVTMESSP